MSDTNQSVSFLELQVTEEIKSALSGLVKWLHYCAMLGLVSACLSIISAVIVLNSDAGDASEGSSFIGSLVGFIISVFLYYTLLQAAKNIKKGLESADQGYFNEGLAKLLQYFRVIGIIAIIVLVILALALLMVLLSAFAA